MNTPSSDSSILAVPPRWDWHYHQLLAIRESLLEDAGVQEEELVQRIEPHSMDMADSGTDEYDHDMALALLSTEHDALQEVDAALQRILHGTYGICEKTGKPISEERLRAVPWTRYTREARERMEKRGIVELPQLEDVASLQGEPPGGLAESPDPAEDELIGLEAARLRQEESIRELAGEEGLDIVSLPAHEP